MLLLKLLSVTESCLERGAERLFTLVNWSDSTDLHSKAKEAATDQLSQWLWDSFALGPRRHCAEWLVTTWIYLTHSPITVLLQQVAVSLPRAAHKSEFHWPPQRNIRMTAVCNSRLLMNSLVGMWFSSLPIWSSGWGWWARVAHCGRANKSHLCCWIVNQAKSTEIILGVIQSRSHILNIRIYVYMFKTICWMRFNIFQFCTGQSVVALAASLA